MIASDDKLKLREPTDFKIVKLKDEVIRKKEIKLTHYARCTHSTTAAPISYLRTIVLMFITKIVERLTSVKSIMWNMVKPQTTSD